MITKKVILKGVSASVGKNIVGKVKVIMDPSKIDKMKKGYILVTPLTNPLYTRAILKAKALVTEYGGVLCHAAIVAREIGIPAIVGVKDATKLLQDDMEIILDSKRGHICEKP